MTDREKLVELLGESLRYSGDYCGEIGNCKKCKYDKCGDNCGYAVRADYMIANGVTVQEWIPVTERLPKSIANKVTTLSENGYVGFGHYENYKGRQTWYNLESDEPFTVWNHDDDSYEVTHWMPLPQAPKGE